MIRHIETRQLLTVRIRPPCAHQNRFHHTLFISEIFLKRGFHGHGVAREIESVGLYRGVDESIDFGEGVGRDYIDCLEGGGKVVGG